MRTRLALTIPAYLLLAVLTTWPALVQIGVAVPGSPRTDLWDSLWSLWFVADSLWRGAVPYQTLLLNAPQGGSLWVADPLGALLAAPWIPWVGLPAAYTGLVLGQLAFSGVVAHRLAEEVLASLRPSEPAGAAAWVGGVSYATAPVLLCGVHNGNSESFAGGWAALAALACWRAVVAGGGGRMLLAAGALLLAALGSGYGGLVAFLFAGALLLSPPPGTVSGRRRGLAVLALGLVLVAPLAWGVQVAATARDNLVGIKDPHETALVRRSTGPADPVAFFMPGDYRSPDFRKISRYGEDFFHCPYLGWTLLLVAGLSLRRGRRQGTGALWLFCGAGAVLALGPVLARAGNAVIFLDDRAMPLPYLLIERLPGFRSLSLVYRLAQAPALGLAVLAAVGLAGRTPVWTGGVCAALVLEGLLLSPLHGLPDTAAVRVSPAIEALAQAPDGAVMNFPVAGGRGYLFEQTVHHKPIAGTLNFPNNGASRRVWQALLDAAAGPPEALASAVAARARKAGVRYVVVHEDPKARPDMYDAAVRALAAGLRPLAEGPVPDVPGAESTGARFVRVYALW